MDQIIPLAVPDAFALCMLPQGVRPTTNSNAGDLSQSAQAIVGDRHSPSQNPSEQMNADGESHQKPFTIDDLGKLVAGREKISGRIRWQ